MAIASSYVTHSSPQGFLGGLASALFTSLAYEDVPFVHWPHHLLHLVEQDIGDAWVYASTLVKMEHDPQTETLYRESWCAFQYPWQFYLQHRFQNGRVNLAEFPDTPQGRDYLYLQTLYIEGQKFPEQDNTPFRAKREFTIAYWPGSKGTDAPLIAYDSLTLAIDRFLHANGFAGEYPFATLTPCQLKHLVEQASPAARKKLFEDLIERACLHGGDSDSTGAIAFYIFAACVGEYALPTPYFEKLEPSIF